MNIVILAIIGVIAIVVVFYLRSRSDSSNRPANLVDEAEVYIAYGQKEKAIKALEEHLARSPEDSKAKDLLRSISK